jgi:hypothetical protein
MKAAWLIYHPKREISKIGPFTIHHDKLGGNEDPYIWNDQFLHTFCHITQLSNVEGQVNFWISGDKYPNFNKLFCDCVFVVKEKIYWNEKNFIKDSDPIVENVQCFEHHYEWANKGHHPLNRRRRYTLKADSEKSFQPQDKSGNLIDILPFLNLNGISTDELIATMTSSKGSRPKSIDTSIGKKLYDYLLKNAAIKIYGYQIKDLHPNKP